MRILDTLKEVVEVWFKKNGQTVKITPHTNTYAGTTDFTLPPLTSGSAILVGDTTTQTLSNKTHTSPTINTYQTNQQVSTPGGAPDGGYNRLYPKTDNRWYSQDSSGIETVLGTGAGSGLVNYILNPDAESSTTGWATYANTIAAATPEDGTGGSANVTWSRNTSSPIRGNADFKFAKDAANRQGQGVSYDFTISRVDAGRMLSIAFDFDTDEDAAYAAGDLVAYIYDVTNATLITPSSTSVPRGASTLNLSFTTSTSTSYRLILHVATINPSAYDLYFDNFIVGPDSIIPGAAISDGATWTPSTTQGFGTITGNNLKYWRVGPRLIVQGSFTTGTVAASEARFGLPFDFLPNTASGNTIVGEWWYNTGNATTRKRGTIIADPTKSYVLFGNDDYTTASAPTTALNGNVIVTSTTLVWFSFAVELAVWSGNGGVNLGPGAQVEYAYNTSTTDASDTSSFGNGPVGASFPGNLTTARSKRVRFQYPIQDGDLLTVEVSDAAGRWLPLPQAGDDFAGYSITPTLTYTTGTAGANTIGMAFKGVSGSTTDVDVQFGRYLHADLDGGNATGWGSIAAARKWRLKKATPSAPVGFGLVTSENSGIVRNYSSMAKIRLHTANGYGSTNVAIRRFTTTVVNTGSGITYADSATDGASFTCTESGIYCFSYGDSFTASANWGLSLNSTQLTTSITGITTADRIIMSTTGGTGALDAVTVTLHLTAGDVVRPHTDGTANGPNTNRTAFVVQRIL